MDTNKKSSQSEMDKAESATIIPTIPSPTKADLEAEIEKLKAKLSEKTETGSALILGKNRKVGIEAANAVLNSQRCQAGNLKKKIPLELLQAVTELDGNEVGLLTDRQITPLIKGDYLSKEDGQRQRAVAQIVKGFRTLGLIR